MKNSIREGRFYTFQSFFSYKISQKYNLYFAFLPHQHPITKMNFIDMKVAAFSKNISLCDRKK